MSSPLRAIVVIEVEIPVSAEWNSACDQDHAVFRKAEELLQDENENVHFIFKDFGEI